MAGLLCLAACGTTATTETDPPTDPANEETDNAGNNVETPDWPKKNITIVVGYSAGGDTDLAARVLADAMSRKLGVSVIVENLAGGSGVVGRTDLIPWTPRARPNTCQRSGPILPAEPTSSLPQRSSASTAPPWPIVSKRSAS